MYSEAMKTTDTLHIYCTPGIREKLEKMAAANKRSMSAEVQVLIERAFENQFKKTMKG